ncbi:MAG TPA: cytochrome P450 [Candidatus Dormibacteraeota bacterium]|jgi:cytochrome P450
MEQVLRSEPPVRPPLPRSPEELPVIFEYFREMRDGHPVVLDEGTGVAWYHLFRYDDVTRVLNDHARFSSNVGVFEGTPFTDTMLVKDPPDHRKLRSLVNLAFTPRAVARLADRIGELTTRLLDRVRERGEMDVVADLAAPLPSWVISEMLGMPEADWESVQAWAVRFTGPDSGVGGEMHAYFGGLADERRRAPRDDLVSALVEAEIDGERLTERELVNFCSLLFLAGQETTKNLIANFFLTLSDHPDVQARLTAEPALMPGAIEEVLRTLPPVWFVMRRSTAEVELGGVRIPAGQMVLPWTASANRDATQFADPERFDIARDPNRHLAFGYGIHFCVGAPLARLEARVALPIVLERLRSLRVRRDEPISIQAGIVFMIQRLGLAFEPY